ncbi:metallothionein expression activator [Phlyctema vagabunda]|uniref:Metallothionein expression activator n=1 Tax=Phlyctema vagabunda TaxID=108571 RepID=A0ABR4PSN9_9HELO
MLSNPISNLQTRQRQHRRQNSTPTAFEAVKVPTLPNIQRHGAHRRGMSLDQRRRQSPTQERPVSITTNQGYQSTPQHILRETQQQRLVRPGQQYQQHYDNDENYKSSPAVTPHRQSFDAGCMSTFEGQRTASPYQYPGHFNSTMPVDPSAFNGGNDFNLYAADGNLTPSAFLDFSQFDGLPGASHSASSSKRSSRRISGGILDRVAQFETMAMKAERPITPPNQNASGYFPLTPAETPFDRLSKVDQRRLMESFDTSMNGTIKPKAENRRFMDSYDTSMEETIKPRNNQRARGVFEDMRMAAESNIVPTPPTSTQISTSGSFDSAPMPSGNFMNMNNLNMGLGDYDPTQYSPSSNNHSPTVSYHSEPSPEMSHMQLYPDPFVNRPSLEVSDMMYRSDGLSLQSSPVQSSHRRSESVTSLNLEESITETGITIDDIATFIQGPDPVDGKWLCLYPECKKRFGRKENIKSHVQTHLGDRQFQCPHCQKCFVRQHDLKRHAKIHTGIKPYPCQCGNSFARHDALTRHRQRGMCIGAFEGVVKKVVKRGRPKKNRPDNEERVSKSSRTRSKNKTKDTSSGSSTSGASDGSYGQSPAADMDILDDKPFEFNDYNQASSSYQYSPAHSPQPTHGVSPHDVQSVHSPSAFSNHSHYSNQHESLPSHRGTPDKSYRSPPGLCDSSSSPAASNKYYDVDVISNHGEDMASLTNISEHDEDMFLEAFANSNGNGVSQMENEPDLLMAKFDDSFSNANGEDLFRNTEDMFFGSP